jgi:hypothetical protein
MHSKKLNLLSHNQEHILVFDCEFWHVFNKLVNIDYLPNRDFFFLPREIAGFLISKNKEDEWKINNKFFVTLDTPLKDIALPISKFSTVTLDTAIKLDQIQESIGIDWVDVHESVLNKNQKSLLLDAIKIYKNDLNVKKRHQPFSWINKFMKIYEKSVIIVKGHEDINALKNLCKIKNFNYKDPLKIIDIANWNKKSRLVCGSAQLENTFRCIIPKLDHETKEVAKQLDFDEAHNPMTDASMTLVVAMYITKI